MKNEPEPELLEALPKPPSYLGRDARRLWKLRGPQLVQMGLLTSADLETFETMCFHYGLMTEAARILKKEGVLVEGERGLVKNPAAQIHRDNSLAFKGYAAKFGMTPTDRGGLDVPVKVDHSGNPFAWLENPFDEHARKKNASR